MKTRDAQSLLNAAFHETAIVLGGIFEAHKVADATVSALMEHLEIVHANALARLAGMDAGATRTKTVHNIHARHPAVMAFLEKLKIREHAECGS